LRWTATSGPVKERDRGLSAGEFLVALAGAQLLGEDCLTAQWRCRQPACPRRVFTERSPSCRPVLG